MASIIHLDGDYSDRVTEENPDLKGEAPVVSNEIETAELIKEKEAGEGKSTLVLDGPLSEIYTQALNLLYGNRKYDVAHQNVGTESAANDQIMASSENKARDAYQAGERSVAYLYVDDGADLQEEGLDPLINKLRVALTDNRYDKVGVCLEGLGWDNPSGQFVTDYVTKMGGRFFYSRAAAHRFMQGL